MLRPWKLEFEIDKKLDKAVYLQIADTIIADIVQADLNRRCPSRKQKPGSYVKNQQKYGSRSLSGSDQ
jgi:hypothetical protein